MQFVSKKLLVVVLKFKYSTSMRVFVFVSTKDPDLLGFTPCQAAENLPPDYGPWTPAEAGGAVLLGGGDANPVVEAVRRSGFFLAVGGYEDEDFLRSARH
jgi:hypothetical protein